jgi:hypothetical protein
MKETINEEALAHLWKSQVIGFSQPGYPFTGMGWTFNWSPYSHTQAGVTEFIARKGAQVDAVKQMSPAEFCSPSD